MAAHDPERRRQAAVLASTDRWSRLIDDQERAAATAAARAASPSSLDYWIDKLGHEKAAKAAHRNYMTRMALRRVRP